MKQPIKAGDRCIVIQGLGRDRSPNVGLTVTVGTLQGTHSRFGRVWRCMGPGVRQLSDAGTYIETGWADFPAQWLQKVDPDNVKDKDTEVNREKETT